MESRVVQVYSMYNSTVNEGRRVRRMRRTQLSAQKVSNNLSQKKGQMTKNRSREKQTSYSHSRSLPKVQPKWTRQNSSRGGPMHLATVQNEYYSKIINVSQFNNRLNSREKARNSKIINKNQNQLNSSKKNNTILNAENSYFRDLIVTEQRNKGRSSIRVQNKSKQRSSIINKSNGQQQLSNFKRPSSRKFENRSSQSKETNKLQSCHRTSKKSNCNPTNQYGLQNQKSRMKSKQASIISSNLRRSNAEQSKKSNKQRRSNLLQVNERNNYLDNSNLSHQKSHNSSSNFIQKEPENFNQLESGISKQIEQNQSRGAPQNFSKLKINGLQNHIIKSSQSERQSWNQAIKSLTQIQNQRKQQAPTNQQNVPYIPYSSKQAKVPAVLNQSRKLQLKMDSQRQDNFSVSLQKFQSTYKHSWRNLPLASKQPSYRKSFQSLSSRPSQPGSLKFVMQNIQFHDYLIGLIMDFQQETDIYNEQQEQNDIMCFLLQKKHFYQKSNMLKALKGGKNIFILSSIQIQNQDLKKYLQTEQIKGFVKDTQQKNIQLFKALQRKLQQIKQKNGTNEKYRQNLHLKLESKKDDFTKQIVRRLSKELDELYLKLHNTESKDEQMQEILENRIVSIMEMIFMMSQLADRKIKKIEFYDEITDFQQYFSQNQARLQQTLQFFQSLR